MKILDLPVHMTDEQFKLLKDEFKDEPMIKVFLSSIVSKAITSKCEEFKKAQLVKEYQPSPSPRV